MATCTQVKEEIVLMFNFNCSRAALLTLHLLTVRKHRIALTAVVEKLVLFSSSSPPPPPQLLYFLQDSCFVLLPDFSCSPGLLESTVRFKEEEEKKKERKKVEMVHSHSKDDNGDNDDDDDDDNDCNALKSSIYSMLLVQDER